MLDKKKDHPSNNHKIFIFIFFFIFILYKLFSFKKKRINSNLIDLIY